MISSLVYQWWWWVNKCSYGETERERNESTATSSFSSSSRFSIEKMTRGRKKKKKRDVKKKQSNPLRIYSALLIPFSEFLRIYIHKVIWHGRVVMMTKDRRVSMTVVPWALVLDEWSIWMCLSSMKRSIQCQFLQDVYCIDLLGPCLICFREKRRIQVLTFEKSDGIYLVVFFSIHLFCA
jgi:hypothetical protein